MEQERKEFEQRFSNDTKEIIALISECGGAGRSGGKKLWQAYAQVLAYKDNGELIDEKKRLVWLLTDKENKKKGKIHKLEKNKIYRLLVKESLSYVHPISSQVIPEGKEMTIIKVLKRDIHDVQLEQIRDDYLKPVYLKVNDYILELDKSLEVFRGEGIWCNHKCFIHLDADNDKALNTFDHLLKQQQEWDDQARKYAADALVECANDWAEDEVIDKETFMKRMSISEVCVSIDGHFDLFYDDGDMFYGHVIIVSGHINDGFHSADFAG